MHLAKKFATAALVLGLAVTPALAADPTGTWQSTTGESRYKVSFCGEGGQLCAQLTWLRDDAKTPETLPYLGKHVLQGAKPTAANRRKGALSYNGDTYKGSVTMVDANALTLKGCDGIFCKSMNFVRI